MGRRMLRALGAGLMETGNQVQKYRENELAERREANLTRLAEEKLGLMGDANAEAALQNERIYDLKVTEGAEAEAGREHTRTIEQSREAREARMEKWTRGAEDARIAALEKEGDRQFSTTMHNDFISQGMEFTAKNPDVQLTPLGMSILKASEGSGWTVDQSMAFLKDTGSMVTDEDEAANPGLRESLRQYRLLTTPHEKQSLEDSMRALEMGIQRIWEGTKGRDASAPKFDLAGVMSMFPNLHKGLTFTEDTTEGETSVYGFGGDPDS